MCNNFNSSISNTCSSYKILKVIEFTAASQLVLFNRTFYSAGNVLVLRHPTQQPSATWASWTLGRWFVRRKNWLLRFNLNLHMAAAWDSTVLAIEPLIRQVTSVPRSCVFFRRYSTPLYSRRHMFMASWRSCFPLFSMAWPWCVGPKGHGSTGDAAAPRTDPHPLSLCSRKIADTELRDGKPWMRLTPRAVTDQAMPPLPRWSFPWSLPGLS